LVLAVNNELKRSEIQERLGLRHEDYFRNNYLLPALKIGVLEMTIPDKPKSSKQKYRLTDKGEELRHQLLKGK